MVPSRHPTGRATRPPCGPIAAALITILPVAAVPALPAQENTTGNRRPDAGPGIEPQFREFVVVEGRALDETVLQVRIRDRDGRPVRDLDLEGFEVSYEGHRCADGRGLDDLLDRTGDDAGAAGRLREVAASDCVISSFRPPVRGRRILAIAVDISGSVIGRDPDGAIPEASMRRLAGAVRSALSRLYEKGDLFLFARFSSRFVVDGPTTDPGRLEQVLLRPWDRRWEASTPYYSMIKVLADTLKSYPESPRAILMFSDCAPGDHPGQKVGDFIREAGGEPDPGMEETLEAAAARLGTGTPRISDGSLDQSLSLGVPVYNINFPDPIPDLRWQAVRDCRAWIRRTGGDSFPLPNPAADIPVILEEIRDAADAAYQIAVRHERAKHGAVRIRIPDRPDLKVAYSGEPVSLGTLLDSLVFKINNGTPEERLEAAHFAARFDHPDIRRALVEQLERESYRPVREAIGRSLRPILTRAICGEREVLRARATSDLFWILPELPDSLRRPLLLGPLDACPADSAYRDALFEWWKAVRDPGIRSALYAANLAAIRYGLEHGDLGRALGRAARMGGDPIRTLLEDFIRNAHPPGNVERRIGKVLSDLDPS